MKIRKKTHVEIKVITKFSIKHISWQISKAEITFTLSNYLFLKAIVSICSTYIYSYQSSVMKMNIELPIINAVLFTKYKNITKNKFILSSKKKKNKKYE